MKRFLTATLTAVAVLASGSAARAASNDNLPQVRAAEINLIRALVDQGVLTMDKARELLRRGGLDPDLLNAPNIPAPAAAGSAPGAVAPPAAPAATQALPEATKNELIEQVRQEVSAQSRAEGRANPDSLPAWVRRISFSGDIRLRYLRDDYASDNSTVPLIESWYQLPAGSIVDSYDSHEYLQMRARFNVDAQINEELKAGVRLVTATGNDSTASPVYYDVELGRYGRPYSAAISLAYLRWQPLPTLWLEGGRMANPYFKSDLIFAPELSLDGVAVGYTPRFSPSWGAVFTAGAHPLQTNQTGPFNSASEQWLYAAQAGIDWTGIDESRLRAAASYYDFSGIQATADPVNPPNNTLNDASAPLFRQFGNTMFDIHYQVLNNTNTPIAPLYGYAAQFRLVNFGAEYEYARFDPLRLAVQLDWVRNVGFNAAQIRQRIGAAINELPYTVGPNGAILNGVTNARLDGYLVNLRMGAAELRHYGDWQVFAGVRYLERDAVPDAFTSPDYRLGGTDNQANFIGVNFGLSPATSVTLRYVAARSIDSAPKFGVDTWFLDFNGRF